MNLAHAIRTLARRVFVVTTEAADLLKIHVRLRKGLEDVLPYYQPYGFSARPLDGAEAVVLKLDGDGAGAIVLVVADRRYRLDLEAGEVGLCDDQGQKIHIKRDRIVVEGQNIELGEGATEAVLKGDALKSWLDEHTHSAGSLTSPSGGVSGTSGAPVAAVPGDALSDVVKTK